MLRDDLAAANRQLELARTQLAFSDARLNRILDGSETCPIPFFSITPTQYAALWVRLEAAEERSASWSNSCDSNARSTCRILGQR